MAYFLVFVITVSSIVCCVPPSVQDLSDVTLIVFYDLIDTARLTI